MIFHQGLTNVLREIRKFQKLFNIFSIGVLCHTKYRKSLIRLYDETYTTAAFFLKILLSNYTDLNINFTCVSGGPLPSPAQNVFVR